MNRAAQLLLLALLLATNGHASAHNNKPRILTEEEIRAVIADDSGEYVDVASPIITVHVANPKLSVVATGVDQSQHRSWFRIRVGGEPGVPDFLVTGPTDLRPAILRAALRCHKPKTSVPIVVPLVIRRGEHVSMIIERPGMRLTTMATALENAKYGEQVRVRIAGSKETLRAIAAGKGVVLRREEP